MTSKAYDHSSEKNSNRVKGSLIGVRNYALIDITGQRNDRKLNVVFKDSNGKELYTLSIDQEGK